ncbi:MAG TPA: hypothetical protein VI981_02615 [Candidatus Paceibacterota bacterium]
MTDKKNTIDDLFSDSGPFDEAEVVKAIQPFVTIQKATNEIFFKSSSQTTEQRILIYGLAKKLLKTKGLIESEMITAVEVQKKTSIKRGSIDPTFKKLKENGFLVGKIDYEIPIPKIPDVIKVINKK